MKFTKHQKEVIRRIFNGDIYDISSYIKYYNLGRKIKFNKHEIIEKFNQDSLPKIYYYPKNLKLTYANIISEDIYKQRVKQGFINPNSYNQIILSLSFSSGNKKETWENNSYEINFYDGVYIANNFNDILEFLTLWQYLKSQMLILEAPCQLTPCILGLFYEKVEAIPLKITSTEEKIKLIDFNHFAYDDRYYLSEDYKLSFDHCTICKDYIAKKIYPSVQLGVFIKKRFRTSEEQAQIGASRLAKLAIIVSILINLFPLRPQEKSPEIISIQQDIKNIKTDIKKSINDSKKYKKLSKEINELLNKLEQNKK